jgi:hypothetical protein
MLVLVLACQPTLSVAGLRQKIGAFCMAGGVMAMTVSYAVQRLLPQYAVPSTKQLLDNHIDQQASFITTFAKIAVQPTAQQFHHTTSRFNNFFDCCGFGLTTLGFGLFAWGSLRK